MLDYNKLYTLRELCEVLGYKYDKKNPKRCLEKIEKEYKLEKLLPRRYRIIRKLSCSEKEMFRRTYPDLYKRCNYDNFLIPWEKRYCGGVYIIKLNNTIYIGQTKKFLNRYNGHRRGEDSNERVGKILRNGATFELLEYEDDLKKRLVKEAKYVKQYKKLDYNVINVEKVLYKSKDKYKKIFVHVDDYDRLVEVAKENNIKIRKEKTWVLKYWE